jgi:hypothetical protein
MFLMSTGYAHPVIKSRIDTAQVRKTLNQESAPFAGFAANMSIAGIMFTSQGAFA